MLLPQAITERDSLQARIQELEGKLQAAEQAGKESASALQAAQRELESEKASRDALQVGFRSCIQTV